MSNFWTELIKAAGTELRYSIAYHPQSNGQSEVVNHCLGTYLRCFAGMRPKCWPQWLSWDIGTIPITMNLQRPLHSKPYMEGIQPPC